MNRLTREHPSPEQLAEFGLGRLGDDASAEIETHLDGCDSCRTIVESLPNDELLALLRNPPPAVQPVTGDTISEPALAAPPSGAIPADLAAHPRYHVLELVGAGGMGAVYKAEHRLMERHVALKVMNPGLMKRPAAVERFEREVKAAARLAHANIVTAHDADQAGGTHFLVMEFVEGVSLAERVEKQGPLPVVEACDYAYQAALGLQHAFECGMAHRDIKPHNLMLTSGGEIKILDFGLARFVREAGLVGAEALPVAGTPPGSEVANPLTEVGVLMGTADFIAPEQATDPHQAEIRSDIYSLGCTLYYLLAGHAPFPGGSALDKLTAHQEREPTPLTRLRDDLPSGLARVVERMMAKTPGQRYQSPAEAARALAPFAGKVFWSRRRMRRLMAAACLCAAALFAAILITIQTDKGEFIIEATDDKVAVLVNNKGVKIRDLAANREYLLKIGRHRIRAGEYKIDVQELPSGLEFSTDSFALKRGADTAVKVTFNTKKDPDYLRGGALGWFPADATFYIVTNMETFPEIGRLQLLLIWQAAGDRFGRLKDLMGPIDRTAAAFAAHRQSPARSRNFLRLTGSIKHNRLVDFFRHEVAGALIEEAESKGERITLIHGGNLGCAVGIIGVTDLIFASYEGPAQPHLELLRSCLEIRAGRGESLPVAQAKALGEIPADAWMFAIGEPPESIRDTVPRLLMLARSLVLSVSGTTNVEFKLRAAYASEADAKLSLAIVSLLKQAFLNAPIVIKDPDLSASVAKTFASLRVEAKADRGTLSVQIPSVAWAALLDKLQDIPLREITAMPSFNPSKVK